jgi:ABC-type sugar transport system substrate-binding protein
MSIQAGPVSVPYAVDLPGLIATVEQTAARRPAGMMVVGWDPSALIPSINAAVESGIPVVCVDVDVPRSKRLSFIGTNLARNWDKAGTGHGQGLGWPERPCCDARSPSQKV